MGFSEGQVKQLSGKLSAKHVKTRAGDGITLSYVEGWHTISEANRIFGFDAWDRETVMADAADQYCSRWGKDKITQFSSRPSTIESSLQRHVAADS